MIREEIKNIKSGKKELYQFGITLGIVFGLLGGWFFWREKSYFFYFFILSLIFLFFGLVLPLLLKPFHKAWMTLALLMGWVVTRIILIILFYLVIIPISFLGKLFGKDFLELKFKKNATDTYWIPKEGMRSKKSNYENQY